MSYTNEEIIKKADDIKSDFINVESLSKDKLSVPVKMGYNHFYTVEYDIIRNKDELSPFLINPKVLKAK